MRVSPEPAVPGALSRSSNASRRRRSRPATLLRCCSTRSGRKCGVQRVGVGPAEHLVLQQRIFDVVEELAKARQQVALGHQQVNRETHVQRALDQVQLLRQPAGFLGNPCRRNRLIRLSTDSTRNRPLTGQCGRALLSRRRNSPPLGRVAGLGFPEDHRAGGVENDAAVGEPPIHVDRAARALQFVLQPGREINAGMADGLGLAGAGFADDHVPRQLVDVLAAALELLQPGLEFLAHLVQSGPLVRVADGLGGGRGLRLDGGGKLLALAGGRACRRQRK